MIHDNDITNHSGNRPFESILKNSMSRRHALKRGAALSATGFLAALVGNRALMGGDAVAAATAPASGAAAAGGGTAIAQGASTLLGFAALPIPEAMGPEASISDDYEYQVLIPWGTPLNPGVPAYDGAMNRPSAEAQTELVGIGHDGIWFFPMDGSSNERGIIAVNHEFGTNPHVLGKEVPGGIEDVRLSQHAHGVTVVEVQKQGNQWQPVTSSDKNRRIHVNTPVTFSGSVAGSSLLETPAGNQPQGTVNNCANGYTPWGTYLTCEENFNGYFGSTLGAEAFTGVDEEGNGIDGITDKRTSPQQRYGFSAEGFGYGWFLYDPRFDLSNPQYKNEENRFGWVVEIDPMNPDQVPVKRTAMGRMKHEGVAITIGQGGRAVGYMGDDGRFEYCYKFVSRANWRSMIARGISPLDEGDLYVAKFNDDGSGEWILLDYDANPALQNSSELSSQEDVLTFTRVAGDVVGATPMDRPEWTTVAPDGSVYWALTNNSQREEPNAPNPLAPNPHGHILVTRDSNNQVGTAFTWEIFILAQDTHSDGAAAFTDPDGLWADPDGRLFIQTDGGQDIGNSIELNNQMLVANTFTGEIRRMFAGPAGCEITGITHTPDRRTMFINVQHPGDGDPSVSNFPAPFSGAGGPIPRDATVVITKKDGGIIGS